MFWNFFANIALKKITQPTVGSYWQAKHVIFGCVLSFKTSYYENDMIF
jgi:hypothetical protein